MNRRLIVIAAASWIGWTSAAYCAEPSKGAPPATTGTPPAATSTQKPAAAPAAAPATAPKPAPRVLTMYTKVDAIDAKTTSFITRENNVAIKFVVTPETEIKNGKAAAKFADIKTGDYVSGSRIRRGENEWEVTKITRIGTKESESSTSGQSRVPTGAAGHHKTKKTKK
jgi:hypothetical protein